MRPRKIHTDVLSEDVVSSEAIEITVTEELNSSLVRSREQATQSRTRTRKPQVNKPGVYFNTKGTPGYHTRYVKFDSSDSYGKIQYLLDKGYRFTDLNGSEKTDLDNVSNLDSLRQVVGIPDKYSAATHYTMQIPIDWYNDDRRKEEEFRRKKDSAIFVNRSKNGAITNAPGENFQFSEFHQEKK